jgi:hypothetical protein
MRRTVLIGAFGATAAAAAAWVACRPGPPPAPELAGLPGLRGFEVVEKIERRHGALWTLSRPPFTVKLEAMPFVDEAAARRVEAEGIATLEALHAGGLSAYPGDLSWKVAPGDEYRPRVVRETLGGRETAYCLLLANDRLGYGVSSPDAATHRSLSGWIHRPGRRTLYKVRIFAPVSSPPERLAELFRRLAEG